ncbi:UNVERIFIED_CONTAM: hypothetical protein Sangu_2444400, partial [Sesamum angustifolium]
MIQYFYEGLSSMDRKLIDAGSGGALFNKTSTEARNLISIMASNTQQFGTRYDDPPRKTNENFQKPQYRPPMPPPSNPKQGTHLEDMMKSLISNTQQIQQNTHSKSSNCNKCKSSSSNKVFNEYSEFGVSNESASIIHYEKNCKKTETKMALSAGTLSRENQKKRLRYHKNKMTRPRRIIQSVDNQTPLSGEIPRYARFSRNYAPAKVSSRGTNGAMCDLGASINVMPLSIFESLHVGPLKETGVVIQLADRSVVYPEGVLEDVLVQVNELVFPTDFYVLDMREDNSPSSTSILLGRPFLKTARTKIDVHGGTLSMEFDGEIIKFNIYDSMRYPSDIPTALLVDVVDPLVQALSSTNSEDHVKFVLEESLTPVLLQILEEDITAPALDLKELPKHLKYAYLGENNTLPVIISSKLNPLEEEKLIRVLREFKKAIGWTIADIKGLSPSICMHRILLKEGTKPSREAQRRLNPPMMEVVKKEILKLLDAGMIFQYLTVR